MDTGWSSMSGEGDKLPYDQTIVLLLSIYRAILGSRKHALFRALTLELVHNVSEVQAILLQEM